MDADRPYKCFLATAIFAVAACYAYYGMEWLFFVSKPSFFYHLTVLEKLSVLVLAPGPMSVFALAILAALALILLPIRKKPVYSISLLAVPSTILGFLGFMLLENFTYTVLDFHVGSFMGWSRIFYLPILLAFAVASYAFLKSTRESPGFQRLYPALLSGTALLCLGLGTTYWVQLDRSPLVGQLDAQGLRRPNIIVLATDGLRARSMSVYGRERQTTPFLDELANQSLVFENHYANNSKTTGSVISMLSGKYPTTTRVVFPPDILRDRDMFEHFPGLLRRHGYYSGNFSVRHYADPFDRGMINGFDISNERELRRGSDFGIPRSLELSFTDLAIFWRETSERLNSRLAHMFFVRDYKNPYLEVAALDHTSMGTDSVRMDQLLRFIRASEEPFFANVHLLNTHGPNFFSDKAVFSGAEKRKPWDLDQYDDAILNFDGYVALVKETLESLGRWQNTILVVSSDHGYRWATAEAVPLIMKFPREEVVGRRRVNSQRIDIAPTLLDFMGAPIPEWMEGVSLLGDKAGELRPIFVGGRAPSKAVKGWREVPNPKPPFYSLGSLTLIYCQQVFKLSLANGRITTGRIRGHTSPCGKDRLLRKEEARGMLLGHLEERQYDVSVL